MSQRNPLNHPKMKPDLFKYLPSEIVIDILSRLPVRSVISCKCVQKSWLQLVENKEFVKSHLSISSPGLITCETSDVSYLFRYKLYRFYEFEDGLDVVHHDIHYKGLTKFNLANAEMIMGSVDGLLFLRKSRNSNATLKDLYICNPITRDYIGLDCPPNFRDSRRHVTYGFGSSSMTSQYKVVMIVHHSIFSHEARKWQWSSDAECYVYTLGTGSWRRHAYRSLLGYMGLSGVYANGNLHWLVRDLSISRFCLKISCFDLETECFSTLSVPCPWNGETTNLVAPNLFAWGGCLGLRDYTLDDETVVWLMKEYGVEESWTHVCVLGGNAYPIKEFKDGDILIEFNGSLLMYYSSKTKTTQKVDMFKRPVSFEIKAMLHTPSFFSLRSFGLDVSSF